MPRSAAAFREADVKRALRGAASAGLKVTRVELDPTTGRIVLLSGSNGTAATPTAAFDQWLEGKDGKAQQAT
jgi:hypothetical protein